MKLSDFTIQERNLISIAFKNNIQTERKAIKLVADIANYDKFAKYDQIMKVYRKRLEKALQQKCLAICELCEHQCIPLTDNSESKVFFMKITADYYRYAVEFSTTSNHKYEEAALAFYRRGLDIACADLDAVNPIRLGICLNMAIHYKEIKKQLSLAIVLTESALQKAIERIDDIGLEDFEDAQVLIKMLQNNLELWKDEQSRLINGPVATK